MDILLQMCLHHTFKTDALRNVEGRIRRCNRKLGVTSPGFRHLMESCHSIANFELDDILSYCMDESGDIITHITINIIKLRGFPVTNG